MPTRWMERERAIMNGLLSLINNDCDLLECLKKQGGQALYDGVVGKVRPTLKVCADEAAESRNQALRDSRTIDAMRIALELVVGHIPNLPPPILDAMRIALPGHPNLS